MKKRRITPLKIMLVVIVLGMGLIGASYAQWIEDFNITSWIETGELKIDFKPVHSVKCIDDGDAKGTKIGVIKNRGTVPAYLKKAVYRVNGDQFNYTVKIGNGKPGQILSAKSSNSKSNRGLGVWVFPTYTGSKDDDSKLEDYDTSTLIETAVSKPVTIEFDVSLEEAIVFNQANLKDEGWIENVYIGNSSNNRKKMTSFFRSNRDIVVPVTVMKTFYTYTEVPPLPEPESTSPPVVSVEGDNGSGSDENENPTVKEPITDNSGNQKDNIENNETENNESENDETENDETENNETENNESENNETENNETENNETENNESENDESENNESENDESENNESTDENQVNKSSNSVEQVKKEVEDKEEKVEKNTEVEKDSNDNKTKPDIEKSNDKQPQKEDNAEVTVEE